VVEEGGEAHMARIREKRSAERAEQEARSQGGGREIWDRIRPGHVGEVRTKTWSMTCNILTMRWYFRVRRLWCSCRIARATEPRASKISSWLAEPVRWGPAGEHAIVILAIKLSKCHFDTAFGWDVSLVGDGVYYLTEKFAG
jgi:hypothetical protein